MTGCRVASIGLLTGIHQDDLAWIQFRNAPENCTRGCGKGVQYIVGASISTRRCVGRWAYVG